ncbi:Centromere subunit L [Plasmopara halstedii]|uniref:Centromere subunit L n=1 Tax=Plasmopara halstedii TaxID=4781 RepID=A0A0P1AV79_PLAHL|nr:Centromere subunit L [Plasmopara halstedii]CEG44853.1 Centromere subunit L [Plasmopara halstedii]|eukprot:XP_024581222.1 Centromere subunit L [Plasmopara halstedii]
MVREAAVLERERSGLEHVLLHRRWFLHYASPLFHFECSQLSEYAHDLVKTLRAAALRACGQQFGYSVSIQNAEKLVVFEIHEERDNRRNIKVNATLAQGEGFERSGGFVLYLQTDVEQRFPPKGRERQQLILMRGDAELLRWICSWLQHCFQCVVSIHVVHIQQQNLKRMARDWAVASLVAEEISIVSEERGGDSQEIQANYFGRYNEPPKAPLLLEYRATNEAGVLRTYTMTVPWVTLRRLFWQNNDRSKGNHPHPHVPELIELVELLYFDSLPFDLSTCELERVEMQQVVIHSNGSVELYSMDFVHAVLTTLLELPALQSRATYSCPETTL